MTGAAQEKIRLLIADDEHLIRGALEALLGLEPDIEVVRGAGDGAEAIVFARETQPDVCLLDLEMPNADGIEAAIRIAEDVPTARTIIVTRHARPGVLRRALAAKVAGFVPKSTPAGELADVIRDVAAGKRYIDPEIEQNRELASLKSITLSYTYFPSKGGQPLAEKQGDGTKSSL